MMSTVMMTGRKANTRSPTSLEYGAITIQTVGSPHMLATMESSSGEDKDEADWTQYNASRYECSHS